MQQKLDELKQLDSRLEKRIEHLGRMEQNLRSLVDSLRANVIEAHPLVGQLNQIRRGDASLIDLIAEQVKHKLAAEPSLLGSGDKGSPEAQSDQSADALATAVHDAIEALNERARCIDGEISATVESAKHYVEQAFAASRQSAGAMLEAIQAKLDEVRSVLADINPHDEPLRTAGAAAEKQLDDAVAVFTAQADATIEAMRRSVSHQVEQLSAQVKIEMKPLLARIDEQRHSAEALLATAAESAERELGRRADELRQNAEKTLELCERQLIDRIANIRPRTRAALDSFEHAANQRVAQSVAELESVVERSEQQAVNRIEALRPHCAEMMRQLHEDMKEQLKRLEDDAVAGVHWLEHRLAGRVEMLKQQIGDAMHVEIEKLDEELRRGRPRPASPVSVQVMATSSRSESAAA
jgi:hypothetical protein